MTIDAYGNENITKSCTTRGCRLRRSRELWDRLTHADEHVIRPHASRADYVLLERQPPGGLGEVTGFFYSQYLASAIFVHPRSVHKFFGIGGYSYDGRKIMSVNIARKWIPCIDSGENKNRRMHDVADAVCIAWYWASIQMTPVLGSDDKPVHPAAWMDVFKY